MGSDIPTAKRCNERGEFLTSDVPPAPLAIQSDTDWFPFSSCVGFELADFLFTKVELSKKKVNHLLELWGATLLPYGIPPPISDHVDLL